jgi:hypothetical protein
MRPITPFQFRLHILSTGLLVCVLTACSVQEPAGDVADEAAAAAADDDICHAMFVQSARGMSFEEGQLTLTGASPNILYFCDRPVREAGHMTWDALMELGTTGEDSFAVDEPNAAVSVFVPGGNVIEAIVTLTGKPSMSDGVAVYSVVMLEGELPNVGDETVIFIDPIGRPRSPTSVAGSHRRHRHRAVRHRR